MSEPVLLLLNGLSSLCELEFGDDNDQLYLQLLRKIKGFGLKRIFFYWSWFGDFDREFCDPDHRSELLRIISESIGSGTLKELCDVPDIFLPHLPHTLKLEKLVASLKSTPLNSNIKDFLQLSAKEVVINVNDCYLPSHLLKNINAQTLHVDASGSWAEGIEENSVEIQANPSIQEISIVLRNYSGINSSDDDDNENSDDIDGSKGRHKIYDIKKIIESIQKGYPNLTLLKLKTLVMGKLDDHFHKLRDAEYLLRNEDFQFFTKLFIKTEALLSELQDLSFSIKIEQVLEASNIDNYEDIVDEISSLRKDEWKDFEEVQDDPRAETNDDPRFKYRYSRVGINYLSLKKSIQFGEGKSLEVTFFISEETYGD